jgi:hypothetical protein
MLRKLAIITTILVLSVVCFAQREAATKEKKVAAVAAEQPAFKASPAYAEILLRKTEIASSLESLVLEYTEEFPKVKELRQTLLLLDRDSARLSKVKSNDVSRLTLALGKLMVKRIELEIELWSLLKTYKEEHPDVKRAVKKVEIYEAAIGEILN